MVYTVTLVSFIILVGSLLAGLTYKLVRDESFRNDHLSEVLGVGITLILIAQIMVLLAYREKDAKASQAPQPCVCAPVQTEAAK